MSSLSRYRMLHRPYARATSTQSYAFYWLTRGDSGGIDRVIIRGEGHGTRLRIERFLAELARNRIGEDARLAGEALRAGWELRP